MLPRVPKLHRRLRALGLAAALAVLVPAGHVLPAGAAPAAAPQADAAALRRFLAAEWDWTMQQDPVWASWVGDRRWNDRWQDLSPDARAARQAHQRAALRKLRAIPKAGLPEADRLNHELYERELTVALAGMALHQDLMPLGHQGGLQTAHELADSLRFETDKDFTDWIGRMRAFPRYAEQTVAVLEEGRKRGLVPPKAILERVKPQLVDHRPQDPKRSPFYAPFEKLPASIPAARQAALRAEAEGAVKRLVIPAFERFERYFLETYLPAAPETPGLWNLPGGAPLYAHLARSYTTTATPPAQLHQLGLAEVKRIRREMEAAKAKAGFTGTLEQFFAAVKADPRFKREDRTAYLAEYRALAKKIDPLLLKLFRRLPRVPYGVEPIPDLSAPNATAAYYVQPASDGSRAGTFYVNTYKPENRPAYEMVPLTLHEAVPGHHFQLALQQELGGLPDFRRHGGYTAYIEGWGLYAESLGQELGLYEDPYVWFGKLNMEMRRALRVVLDTGLHSEKWSRQQAIDFFRANAAKSEMEIVNEVDRYLGNPGQALAYKIGELKIQELRARATRKLGARFDVRAFHDVVLRDGALPLDVLERRVDAWVAAGGK